MLARPRRPAPAASPTAATTSCPKRSQQPDEPLAQQHRVLGEHDPQGTALHPHHRRPAGRAGQPQPSADRGDPVGQPGQPAARAGSAPPRAVVAHLARSAGRRASRRVHLGPRGPAVLGDVRQGLGDDEVRRQLHRRRQPLGQPDVDRRPGTAARSASSRTAAARPWSVSTCGWTPRISSRSSRQRVLGLLVGARRAARRPASPAAGPAGPGPASWSARPAAAGRRRAGPARSGGARRSNASTSRARERATSASCGASSSSRGASTGPGERGAGAGPRRDRVRPRTAAARPRRLDDVAHQYSGWAYSGVAARATGHAQHHGDHAEVDPPQHHQGHRGVAQLSPGRLLP